MLSWMYHDVMDVSWCHGCIMMLVRSEHACYIDSWCSSCTMMQLMYHDALVVPWCHGCSMIELMHVICVGPCYVNDVVCCLLWTVLLCCTFSNFTNPYTVYIKSSWPLWFDCSYFSAGLEKPGFSRILFADWSEGCRPNHLLSNIGLQIMISWWVPKLFRIKIITKRTQIWLKYCEKCKISWHKCQNFSNPCRPMLRFRKYSQRKIRFFHLWWSVGPVSC